MRLRFSQTLFVKTGGSQIGRPAAILCFTPERREWWRTGERKAGRTGPWDLCIKGVLRMAASVKQSHFQCQSSLPEPFWSGLSLVGIRVGHSVIHPFSGLCAVPCAGTKWGRADGAPRPLGLLACR